MGIAQSIATFLFGCGVFGAACGGTHVPPQVSVQTVSSSSPDVHVTETIDGKTHTEVLRAPYGVRTSIVTNGTGTHEMTEATTTPLTQADVAKMQAQAEAMQRQMNQMFAEQQKIFNEMQAKFW